MRGSPLVIGADNAGLTTGIALRHADWDVTVFERAPDLSALQADGGIHPWRRLANSSESGVCWEPQRLHAEIGARACGDVRKPRNTTRLK